MNYSNTKALLNEYLNTSPLKSCPEVCETKLFNTTFIQEIPNNENGHGTTMLFILGENFGLMIDLKYGAFPVHLLTVWHYTGHKKWMVREFIQGETKDCKEVSELYSKAHNILNGVLLRIKGNLDQNYLNKDIIYVITGNISEGSIEKLTIKNIIHVGEYSLLTCKQYTKSYLGKFIPIDLPIEEIDKDLYITINYNE